MSPPSEPVELARLLGDPPAREHAADGSSTAIADRGGGHRGAATLGATRAQPAAMRKGRGSAAREAIERRACCSTWRCTADGRATIGGRSGPIGNRADHELFHALRTAVDAVLVGAGTVRAEHYGRLVREDSARALRRARGLAEEPLACIISASLGAARG